MHCVTTYLFINLYKLLIFYKKTSGFFFLTFRCIYKTYTHHLSLDIQQIVHQIALWYCQCCIFVMVHQRIIRTNFNPENIFIIPSVAKLLTPTQSVWYKSNTCSTDLVCVRNFQLNVLLDFGCRHIYHQFDRHS